MDESSLNPNIFDKSLEFLNKNLNLIVLGLLVVTFLLRLKYMTVNAGLWWDESDYLRLAKHYAFGLQDIAAPYRERAMTMVWGVLYKFGANEWIVRFIEQVLYVVATYFVYLFGKEFYNKKIGVVAALIFSVIWVNAFWATRISLELHTMTFWVIAAYLFWKGYVQQGKAWYVVAAAMLVAFGTYAYSSMGLSLFFYLAFVLITERFGFLKNKRFWYAAIAAMLIVVPFMIYSYESFGHVYPRFQRTMQADWTPLAQGSLEKVQVNSPISLFFAYSLGLPDFVKWPFFILFLIGLIYLLFELIVGFDLLVKNRELILKKDLYIFLWAFTVLLMFSIVYTTTGFEFDPRFLVPMYPALAIIAAKGLFKLYDLIKKYNKPVAFVTVTSLLAFGVYSNLTYADSAINAKKDSYMGEREAGLWIKENTSPGDYVLTCNQAVVFGYYTERNIDGFGANVTLADEQIDKFNPRYVVLDIYHPDCAFNLQKESSHDLVPVFVSFADKDKKQPAVIIYEPVKDLS